MSRNYHYQIVWIPAAWRRRSRVTSGRPRWRAVAAMIRSGMSGTTSRGMFGRASATPASTGAMNSPEFGSVRAERSRSSALSGSLRLSTRYTVSTKDIADTCTSRASRTASSIVVRATADNSLEFSKSQSNGVSIQHRAHSLMSRGLCCEVIFLFCFASRLFLTVVLARVIVVRCNLILF